MRWLYHVIAAGAEVAEPYAPPSLLAEGFVHCSLRDAVAETARLYFPAGSALSVLRIDPRRLDARVEIVDTPRGPMPHVHGPIPADAIVEELSIDEAAAAPDHVTGARVAFVCFEGMTLLDLVGAYDAIARIASMGIDPTATCEWVAARPHGTGPRGRVWAQAGAEVTIGRLRPDLGEFDLVVIPGGPGADGLAEDPVVTEWLAEYPPNRLLATVCTGALVAGAAGRLRGRRATTHARAMQQLAAHGAEAVAARVVEDGALMTAGGVTAAIDLGLHVVRRLHGYQAAATVARQMEHPLIG